MSQPPPMRTKLLFREIGQAWSVAGQRAVVALKDSIERNTNGHGAYGARVVDEQADVLGCLGEIAVAKAFNLYWSGKFGDAGDVGFMVEVRASFKRPRLGLVVHHKDKDHLPFVCVDLSKLP